MADIHQNRSYKVVIATAVSFAIATTALILRLVSRWLMRKRLETNDYLIIVAYIPKLGIDIASILLLNYGLGQHIEVVPLPTVTNFFKVVYVGSFLYAPCISFIKLSILSLYWVAFPFRYIRISSLIIGGIVIAWGISLVVTGLLQCLPIRKSWDRNVPGTCINTYDYYYGLQIPNIITDAVIIAIPFKALLDLKLGKSKTIQLCAVFSLAITTLIFDIVRLVALVKTPKNTDYTWNLIGASMWTDLEPSVAYLVACLPIMRPLLHPRRFWEARQQGSSQVDEDEDYGYSLDESPGPKADHERHEEHMSPEMSPHAL